MSALPDFLQFEYPPTFTGGWETLSPEEQAGRLRDWQKLNYIARHATDNAFCKVMIDDGGWKTRLCWVGPDGRYCPVGREMPDPRTR